MIQKYDSVLVCQNLFCDGCINRLTLLASSTFQLIEILRHIKENLPKYLLVVSLLFSSIAFSGYTGHSRWSEERTEQAEISKAKSEPVHQVVSWEKVFFYFAVPVQRLVFVSIKETRRFAFDRLVKVRLFACQKEVDSFFKTPYFTEVKTIPSASDEDVFVV